MKKGKIIEFGFADESFVLAIEETEDGERIQRDNDESAKAKAEAETKQERLL